LAKFTGQSVPEVQETANLQILSLQKSLFSSAAFWQRLAGQDHQQFVAAIVDHFDGDLSMFSA
jgi:arginine deiminase